MSGMAWIPKGRYLGTDVSDGMIAIARSKS
jgi:hypothetical protein